MEGLGTAHIGRGRRGRSRLQGFQAEDCNEYKQYEDKAMEWGVLGFSLLWIKYSDWVRVASEVQWNTGKHRKSRRKVNRRVRLKTKSKT